MARKALLGGLVMTACLSILAVSSSASALEAARTLPRTLLAAGSSELQAALDAPVQAAAGLMHAPTTPASIPGGEQARGGVGGKKTSLFRPALPPRSVLQSSPSRPAVPAPHTVEVESSVSWSILPSFMSLLATGGWDATQSGLEAAQPASRFESTLQGVYASHSSSSSGGKGEVHAPVPVTRLEAAFDADDASKRAAELVVNEITSYASSCAAQVHASESVLDSICGCGPPVKLTEPDLASACDVARPHLLHDGRLALRGRPLLMLGVGVGHVSLRVAAALPNVTVLSVAWSEGRDPSQLEPDAVSLNAMHAALKYRKGVWNDWILALPTDAGSGSLPLTEYLNRVRASRSVQFGALWLLSLTDLTSPAQLPHEVEELLARMLALAPYLILPATLPQTRLFSYWDGVQALLAAAADRADVVLSLRPLGGGLKAAAPGLMVVGVQSPKDAEIEDKLYAMVAPPTTTPAPPVAPGARPAQPGAAPAAAPAAAAVGVAAAKPGVPAVTPSPSPSAAPAKPKEVPTCRVGLPWMATLSPEEHTDPVLRGIPLSVLLDMGLVPSDAIHAVADIIAMPVRTSSLAAASVHDIIVTGSSLILARGHSSNRTRVGKKVPLSAPLKRDVASAPATGAGTKLPAASVNAPVQRGAAAQAPMPGAAAAAVGVAPGKAVQQPSVQQPGASKPVAHAAAGSGGKQAGLQQNAGARRNAAPLDAPLAAAPMSKQKPAEIGGKVATAESVDTGAKSAAKQQAAPAVAAKKNAAPPPAVLVEEDEVSTTSANTGQGVLEEVPAGDALVTDGVPREEAGVVEEVGEEKPQQEDVASVRNPRRAAAVQRDPSGGLFHRRSAGNVGGRQLMQALNVRERDASAALRGTAPRSTSKDAGSVNVVVTRGFGSGASGAVAPAVSPPRGSSPLLSRSTQWERLRPIARRSGTAASPAAGSLGSESARTAQALLVHSESEVFASWWALLRRLHALGDDAAAFNAAAHRDILMFGKNMGLLATKAAQSRATDTIVSVYPAATAPTAHADLLRLLRVPNNLLATSSMDVPRLRALTSADERLDVSLWEDDLVSALASDALGILYDYAVLTSEAAATLTAGIAENDQLQHVLKLRTVSERADALADVIAGGWEQRLALTLKLSHTSLLHLPPFTRLLTAIRLLAPRCPSISPCALGVASSSGAFAPTEAPHASREPVSEGDAGDEDVVAKDAMLQMVAAAARATSHSDAVIAAGTPGVADIAPRVTAALLARYTTLARSGASVTGGGRHAVAAAARGAADATASVSALPASLQTSYGPYQALFSASLSAAHMDDIATVRFHVDVPKRRTASMRVYAIIMDNKAQDGSSAAASASPGFSLHALLTLNVSPAARARLLRMLLSLPLANLERTSADASIAPWRIRLAPDMHASCSSRLRVDAGSTRVLSPVCFNHASDDDDTVHAPQLAGEESLGGASEAQGEEESDAEDDVAIRETWSALASQMLPADTATGGAPGKFSFVEYNSGMGHVSLLLARAFPNATVLSVDSDETATNAHLASTLRTGLHNNIIARAGVSAELFKKLYDSPEFFRYQMLSGDFAGFLLRSYKSLDKLQASFGTMFALAATTFLHMPTATHISLAFTMFAEMYPDGSEWVLPPVHAAMHARVAALAVAALSGTEQAFTGLHARGDEAGLRDPWWRQLPGTRYTRVNVQPHLHSAGNGAPCLLPWAPGWTQSPLCNGQGSAAAFDAFTAAGSGRDAAQLEALEAAFLISAHPRAPFVGAEMRLLAALVRAPAKDSIRIVAAPVPARLELPADMDSIVPATTSLAPVSLADCLRLSPPRASGKSSSTPPCFNAPLLLHVTSGLVRVDLANLTRHVNHHFMSEQDGHTRKYTLHVSVNDTAGRLMRKAKSLPPGNHPNAGHSFAAVAADAENVNVAVKLAPSLRNAAIVPGVTSIILTRDMDNALIPYDTVHGITLITILRLGLVPSLRMRAYHQFVALPLYLDMAPWNIVFVGPRLDYIDYDTRDRSYDKYVVKAYEIMEVLFNYKRTVEDFKKCGGKSSNPYGFPFVSECVGGSEFTGPCKDSKAPVPCGDGTCKSDYVSCLRSMSERDREDDIRQYLRWAFAEYAKASEEQEGGDGALPLPAPAGEQFSGKTDMATIFGPEQQAADDAAAASVPLQPQRDASSFRDRMGIEYDPSGVLGDEPAAGSVR